MATFGRTESQRVFAPPAIVAMGALAILVVALTIVLLAGAVLPGSPASVEQAQVSYQDFGLRHAPAVEPYVDFGLRHAAVVEPYLDFGLRHAPAVEPYVDFGLRHAPTGR